VARRAGVPLAAFGLTGHFVCGHVGVDPPVLIDPFRRGAMLSLDEPPPPYTPHQTAMRMLNNLVASYSRRGDLGRALRGAKLRLALPCTDAERAHNEHELRAIRACLN
jgi:regulator of sirC expression with transglutaminase-like and TPR domain